MNLATVLKESTSEAHRRAESGDLQRLLVAGELQDAYLIAYLAQLQRVHRTIEDLFTAHPEVAALIGWNSDFEHSRRLAVDLAALGNSDSNLRPVRATELVLKGISDSVETEPASLIGYFYVLEGSMNGNRFIAKALSQSPAGTRCEFTYFDPYGDAQRGKWGAVRAALESMPLSEAQQGTVVQAAHAMFDGITAICSDVMQETAVEAPSAARGPRCPHASQHGS